MLYEAKDKVTPELLSCTENEVSRAMHSVALLRLEQRTDRWGLLRQLGLREWLEVCTGLRGRYS